MASAQTTDQDALFRVHAQGQPLSNFEASTHLQTTMAPQLPGAAGVCAGVKDVARSEGAEEGCPFKVFMEEC